MNYLHEHGFVHRDLKVRNLLPHLSSHLIISSPCRQPENVIYATEAEDSLFKIVDFGLARCYLTDNGYAVRHCGLLRYALLFVCLFICLCVCLFVCLLFVS